MKEFIFHLGYPKTATKSLQYRVFNQLDSILYLGKYSAIYTPEIYKKTEWIENFRIDFILKDKHYFKNFDFFNFLQKQYPVYFNKYEKLLLSDESIFIRCMSPLKYHKNFCLFGSIYNVLEKIKLLTNDSRFNKTKLIIVTRRQDTMIESLYAEHYEHYKRIGIKSPDDLVSYITCEGVGLPIEASLHYDQIIEYADSLFGKENVLAIPYELLLKNSAGFLRLIANHMGISTDIDKFTGILSSNKENVRNERGVGKRINKKPFLIKLVKKMTIVKKVAYNLSYRYTFFDSLLKYALKFTNNIATKCQKSKYVKMTKNAKIEIMKYYENSNKRLVQRVPETKDFNYFDLSSNSQNN